jgi:hypothetical protein
VSNFNVSLPPGEPGFFGALMAAFGGPPASAVDFLMSGTEYEEVPLVDEDEVDSFFDSFVEFSDESQEGETYLEESDIVAVFIDETPWIDTLEYRL